MENKLIYDLVKEVPKEAQKPIKGGRLSGMTDIKPMWRIEKLTEVFGPAGLGWYAPIKNKEIIEGANGEKIAIVDINLFVNYKKPYNLNEDLWSEAIEGTGGSSFVAKEKSGLYVNDECFKMAYTDALSVACKSLGMGAKVYWGDSKYNQPEEITTEKEAREYKVTFGKKYNGKTIGEIYDAGDESYLMYLLDHSSDTNIKKAVSILTGIVEHSPEETKEIVNDLPITEPQKQQLKDKYADNTDELKLKICSLGKMKLSELTYAEADKLLGE